MYLRIIVIAGLMLLALLFWGIQSGSFSDPTWWLALVVLVVLGGVALVLMRRRTF